MHMMRRLKSITSGRPSSSDPVSFNPFSSSPFMWNSHGANRSFSFLVVVSLACSSLTVLLIGIAGSLGSCNFLIYGR